MYDDVGRSLRGARRALELAGPEPSPFSWTALTALGHALYLSGRPAEAQPELEELVRRVSAAEQPYAVVTALAVLSLIAGDEGRDASPRRARSCAVIARRMGSDADRSAGSSHGGG